MHTSVQYLPRTQFNFRGTEACAQCSLFIGVYFAYSSEPLLGGIDSWMEYSCAEWLRWREDERRKAHIAGERGLTYTIADKYSTSVAVHQRYAMMQRTMALDADPEVNGLSLSPKALASITLHDEWRQAGIVIGVLPAIKRLAERAAALPEHHSLVFTFCRGMSTIGGCVRSLGNGTGVIFDLVDSHTRVLKDPLPPTDLPNGSAIWIRCRSPETLARYIEAIYPPSDDTADLIASPDMHLLDYRPASMYNLTVFRPLAGSPAQASAIIAQTTVSPPRNSTHE